MAALTELVSDIRASIPEIPTFIARRYLLRATRTFCEETRAWRTNINVSTIAGQQTVALTTILPTNTELVDIISMKNTGGGEPVHSRTKAWLDKNRSDWRSETALNALYYTLQGNNTLRLVPTPSATSLNLYDVRVAVKPLLAATTLDDILVNKYREDLINGALGHLFLIPRKPWTDLNLGQYHQTTFINSWPGARAEAADEFQTGVARKIKYGGL